MRGKKRRQERVVTSVGFWQIPEHSCVNQTQTWNGEKGTSGALASTLLSWCSGREWDGGWRPEQNIPGQYLISSRHNIILQLLDIWLSRSGVDLLLVHFYIFFPKVISWIFPRKTNKQNPPTKTNTPSPIKQTKNTTKKPKLPNPALFSSL